ncbi:hypothetical protein DV738_g3755, partial [Chaetothyriales sp. CBS 135597]
MATKLRILVPIKRVIDYAVKPRVKSDKTGVETANVKHSMNPFDELSVEEAVRLREKDLPVEDILAVSAGPAKTVDTLRLALAVGADRALHVQVPENEPLEPLTVAKLLKAVVEKEESNLIFLGKQAIDDDAGQTGQILAGLLNWPQATQASQVEIDGDNVTVTREVDGGVETLQAKLPMIITTDLRLNVPRYASLPNIMKAKKKKFEKKTLQDYGVEAFGRLKTVKVEEPQPRKGGGKVEDVDGMIGKFKELGVLVNSFTDMGSPELSVAAACTILNPHTQAYTKAMMESGQRLMDANMSKAFWSPRSTRNWTARQRAKYANSDNPALWVREGGITGKGNKESSSAAPSQAPTDPSPRSGSKIDWAKNFIRKLSKSDKRAAKYLINNTASTSNENLAALVREAEARQAHGHALAVGKIAALRKAALQHRQISEEDWERAVLEDDEYQVVRARPVTRAMAVARNTTTAANYHHPYPDPPVTAAPYSASGPRGGEKRRKEAHERRERPVLLLRPDVRAKWDGLVIDQHRVRELVPLRSDRFAPRGDDGPY